MDTRMTNILTDSCCDLNPELLSQFGIEIISLSVFIDNTTYLDRTEIDFKRLFELVEKTGSLPKTSAPTLASLQQFLDREGETLFIGISSKLSATVNNALLAAQTLSNRKITVLDSLNLSAGIGLLAIKAAELRDQGLSMPLILEELNQAIPNVHTSFVIDTLDYLYKGGRCSALTMVVGSLLKIRPVIEVNQDGTLGVKGKITGTRRKALNSLLLDFQKHLNEVDTKHIFITHTGCEADAQYLAGELSKLIPIQNLHTTHAGATIASHCGPNTIGILYLTHQKT